MSLGYGASPITPRPEDFQELKTQKYSAIVIVL